jgi:hypothetical protein
MRILFFAALMSVSSAAVFAADTPPAAPPAAPMLKSSLVRGTVQAVGAATITIKTDAGAIVVATITPKTRYAFVEARTFNQIKATDFVGITAVPGTNGHLRAEEVHILPVVGLGEGQYPWDHHPSMSGSAPMSTGSMTNGSVTAANQAPMMGGSMTNGTVTAGSSNGQLTVTYHGAEMVDGKCSGRAVPGKPGCTGTAIADVTPSTFIQAVVFGKIDDIKPGLAVVANVGTDDAGHVFLGSATVEKNGVKPAF